MSRLPLPEHVEQSAIVLDDVQLLYVPVPKAGSTAMLWALAELAGLDAATFTDSPKLEVTRALTVHDLRRWEYRNLAERSDAEVADVFESDDWLRFTVVREPVRRLWSAWSTKVLVHDPRFVAMFGDEAWFPDVPRAAEEVVEGFRRFVGVLGKRPGDWHDPHWSSQAELLGLPELGYHALGRVEDQDATLARVNEHLRASARGPLRVGRRNRALLTFAPGLVDEATATAARAFTERDRVSFGYEPVEPAESLDPEWVTAVEAALPALRGVIARNERIGDLGDLLKRSRAS
jgi:hypothetical protein